jgi:hypothetical protein
MFSMIRMPFAAITLMLSVTVLPGKWNEKLPAATATAIHTAHDYSSAITEKYTTWNLEKEGISVDLFSYAIRGYEHLKQQNRLTNTGIISIIDFSKPSSEKRLFILDTETGKLLFKTLVAHGRNSGRELASTFSNTASSFASSLGFYITSETYSGKHGYSLRLNGCERGFNDNAYKRAVVVHGADYVSESFVRQNGFLGRSHGCPAIPIEFSKKIIDLIKNGSCLFIYSPQKKYLTQSAILNPDYAAN